MEPRKQNIAWRTSDARRILIKDLETGVLPLDAAKCSADEAWERYRSKLPFLHVPYKQFCKQLAAHREQLGRIDWKNSEARVIIVKHLQQGELSLDESVQSAEHVWVTKYMNIPAFQDVPFSQFKERLADHRAQVKKDCNASLRYEEALCNSRAIYPRAAYNHKGQKVFDMSPAKSLLRHDIKAGLGARQTPEEIRVSRPEYLQFEKEIFHNHVRQEIRRRKRVNSKWNNAN